MPDSLLLLFFHGILCSNACLHFRFLPYRCQGMFEEMRDSLGLLVSSPETKIHHDTFPFLFKSESGQEEEEEMREILITFDTRK